MRVLEAIIVPLLACGAYAAVAAVPVGGGAVIIEHEIAPNLDVPARAHAARAPGDEPPAAEVDCDTANSLSTQSGSAPAPYTSLSAFPTAVDPLPTPYTSLSAFPTMMSTSTTEASAPMAIRARADVAAADATDTVRRTTLLVAETVYASPTVAASTSGYPGDASPSGAQHQNDDRTCVVREKTCFGYGKNTCCSIYGYCGSGPEYCLPAICNPYWGYCSGHDGSFEGAQYLVWNSSLKAGLAQIHHPLEQKSLGASRANQDLDPHHQDPIRRSVSLQRRAFTTIVNVVTEANTVTAPAAATTTILMAGTPPPTNTSSNVSPLTLNSTQLGLEHDATSTVLEPAESSTGVPVGVMVIDTTAVVTVAPSSSSTVFSGTAHAFMLTDPINTNITTVVHGTSISRTNNTSVDTESYINISTFRMSGQPTTSADHTSPPHPAYSASTTTASASTTTATASTTSTDPLVGHTGAVTSKLGSHHSSDAVEFNVPPVPALMVLALALCFGVALFL